MTYDGEKNGLFLINDPPLQKNFFRKLWKNVTNIFFFRPISMNIFLGRFHMILRKKMLLLRKKNIFDEKMAFQQRHFS